MGANVPLSSERDDPYLLSADDCARLLRDAPWTRFAAVGDSGAEGITEPVDGYSTRPWFDRVAAELRQVRPHLATRNFGKKNLLATEVRATQLEPALEFGPDLVVVLSGGNDILQREFSPAGTESEIVEVVSVFLDRGMTVVTMGLFDITTSPYVPEKYRKVMSERIALLSGMVRDIAERLGALHVDLPSHPAGKEAIFSTDGLHLNARGQAIVATETVRRLGCHLGNQLDDH
ncbi:MAG TPA: SGNH/GDSL hydrolase family protein [Streptosporangiaceae bacterium]